MGSETRAAQLFQQGHYNEALQAYTACINRITPNTRLDVQLSLLFNRSACYLKLKKFDKVVADCTTILSLEPQNDKALSRKIKALCSLGRFSEAQTLGKQWLLREPQNQKARLELERINTIVKALQDQDGEEDGLEPTVTVAGERVPPEGREDDSTNQSPNTATTTTTTTAAAAGTTQSTASSTPVTQTSSRLATTAATAATTTTTTNQITNPIVSSLFSNPYLVTTTASSNLTPTLLAKNSPTSIPNGTVAEVDPQLSLGGFPVTTVTANKQQQVTPSTSYKAALASGIHFPATSTGTQSPAPLATAANNDVAVPVTSIASASPTTVTHSVSNSTPVITSNAFANASVGASGTVFKCSYCHVTCESGQDFKTHCSSEEHHKMLKLDSVKEWKHRPPPRGLTSQEYTKCPRNFGEGTCRFGDNCSQAHSESELQEWKERFEHHKRKVQQAKQDNSHGNAYADSLMQRWMTTENKEAVMAENIEGVHVHVNTELDVTMSSKKSSHNWLLTVTSRASMKKVALLDDSNRKHFWLASITVGPKRSQKSQELKDQCQEWNNTSYSAAKTSNERVYRIKVMFKTDIYGTFRQSVVMDFGSEPVLVKQLCVDSAPVTDLEQLTQDLKLTDSGRWDLTTKTIVEFQPKFGSGMLDSEKSMLEKYPLPMASKFAVSESLLEPELSRDNYKPRTHNILFIEEMAQFSSIARFNLKATLQLVSRFLLVPSTGGSAKFAQGGELYARMKLSSDLSEDTAHGRLILQNVHTVYLAPVKSGVREDEEEPQIVYEALVEEKVKQFVYLRLSNQCVTELGLYADRDFNAHVQFHLNRLPLCEMHHAVDQLRDLNLVFPCNSTEPCIPWNPLKQWHDKQDCHLNVKQKEAVVAITTDIKIQLPPVLIVGPYGTGKTFTLAQAAKEILRQEDTRVLICTYSNSAADLYIRDYLHPYVEEGHEEAKPLRIYYRQRWVQTVNATVLDYCMLERLPHGSYFIMPSKEKVEKHRVVVTTLSTSQYLGTLGLEDDFFTHILLDEAAQAMECQTIMPLALASKNTRIVLAGDHMQLSPEIHSDFARDRGLHLSLLERLYDYYPANYPCKILLCENYRSHKAIIDYTSELFYENRLVASGNQPAHQSFYPLTFFTARGEDMHHQNSTAFYNSAEVYEIADRVTELKNTWPEAWGSLDENCIGVVTPYADQVFRIRAELRKRKLGFVSVERVLNVQGKQFRVILLSTVRTRLTCSGNTAAEEDVMDYGFLSNVKLLNTAITRAQSLVAVVGDPVSLCSVGKCRKLWERFLELCQKHHSLHGITWSNLRAQLDGVELKKTYVLNPLAPEFVPNRLRHTQYGPPEPVAYGKYGYTFLQPQQRAAMSPGKPNPYMAPAQMPVSVQAAYPAYAPQLSMAMNEAIFLGSPKVRINSRGKQQQHRRDQNSSSPLPDATANSNRASMSPSDRATAASAASAAVAAAAAAADTTRLFQGSPLGGPARVIQPLPLRGHLPQTAAAAATSRAIKLPYAAYPQQLAAYPVPQQYHLPGVQRVPPAHPVAFSQYLGAPLGGPRMVIPGSNLGSVTAEELAAVGYQGHHVQKVDGRLMTSPPKDAAVQRQTSPSPAVSDSGPASPQLQFLPNACNIYNPGSRGQVWLQPTASAAPPAHNKFDPSWRPNGNRLSTIEDQLLLKNAYLQQELYSYILQTEGKDKAGAFMHLMQQTQHLSSASAANNSLLQTVQQQQQPQQQLLQQQPRSHLAPASLAAHHNNEQSRMTTQAGHYLPMSDHHRKETATVSVRKEDRDHHLGLYSNATNSSSSGRGLQQHKQHHLQQQQQPQQHQRMQRHLSGDRYVNSYGASRYGHGVDTNYINHEPRLQQQQQQQSSSRATGQQERREHNSGSQDNDLYGDDLDQPPPAVQHMMKLIDDGLEDASSEPELSSLHTGQQGASQIPTISAPATGDRPGPLYMRRSGQRATTSPHMSYAGALRSQPLSGNCTPQGDGLQGLTPATPHTPAHANASDNPFFKGASSSSDPPDPLELLKNLNIKASPGTQALYQYFS